MNAIDYCSVYIPGPQRTDFDIAIDFGMNLDSESAVGFDVDLEAIRLAAHRAARYMASKGLPHEFYGPVRVYEPGRANGPTVKSVFGQELGAEIEQAIMDGMTRARNPPSDA